MNWLLGKTEASGEASQVQSSRVLTKVPDSTISVKTIARTLEALVNPDITDKIAHGADETNDTLKFKPMTETGKQEHNAKVQAKQTPLKASIDSISATLTQNVKLDTLMDEYNRYVFMITFNGESKHCIITPSVHTKSLDIEIEGKSENVNITMKALVGQLKVQFPVQQHYGESGHLPYSSQHHQSQYQLQHHHGQPTYQQSTLPDYHQPSHQSQPSYQQLQQQNQQQGDGHGGNSNSNANDADKDVK